jgi:hypothetical protein
MSFPASPLIWSSPRLWRLPPGATALEPVVNSPRVTRLEFSGGVLIAYTGTRTIAVSTDGTKWTPVTPGSAVTTRS